METTPGPWVVQYDEIDGTPRAIKTADGEHVTFVDGSRYVDEIDDPEAAANARLIAAAPEMLTALKQAEAALAVTASYRAPDMKRQQAALEAVRAAIAKATGQAP
jgi:hypothetical protein